MPVSKILALGLDDPRMTPQQIADQALVAWQRARQVRSDRYASAEEKQIADDEAYAIADVFAKRGIS